MHMQVAQSVTDVIEASVLLRTLKAFKKGDFSARVPLKYSGVAGEVAEVLNEIIEMNEGMSEELRRISKVVGKEGKLSQRATLPDAGGSWSSCLESINDLIADLVQPTTEVGRMIGAVASGDLSQKMTLSIDGRRLRGELLRTAKVVNGMVDQLGSFASEVTEARRNAAEVLDAVRRQNDLIVNAVGEGICGFDGSGHIVFANPAAARITGWRREELIGQPAHALFHHTRADGTKCSGEGCDIYAVVRGRTAAVLDGELMWRKDGASIPVDGVGTLLPEGAGVVSVMVFRDVTERKQLERERARLMRDLQEAVRVRDDFLSIASHELRTPLTPIRLGVQSLRRRGQKSSAGMAKVLATQLETMDRQVGRMDTLISELLDVSRITMGRLDLEMQEVDLVALVREVLGRFQLELERGGYEVELSADRSVVGKWDRLRVDQVIGNLLSNAIKYGGTKRPIEIDVGVAGGRAVLSMRDYGIGISPEDQGRIFQRFERLISVRHYGGFGLGLWIVRQIVDAHGGTVRVESEPGVGSTFTVELPRLIASMEDEREPPEGGRHSNGETGDVPMTVTGRM